MNARIYNAVHRGPLFVERNLWRSATLTEEQAEPKKQEKVRKRTRCFNFLIFFDFLFDSFFLAFRFFSRFYAYRVYVGRPPGVDVRPSNG